MIKILPSLNEGIQVVGFLREVENKVKDENDQEQSVNYIVYNADSL